VGSRMRVCLLGTGGAANEARHQAGVLVAWGQGAGGGQILLDTGAGLDIVRVLIAGKWEPAEVRDIFVSHRHLDHVGGLEPLLLWNIIKALRSQRYPPSDETRVYADRRVLAAIEELFGVITTAVPRLFRDKLKWIESADGGRVELRGGRDGMSGGVGWRSARLQR
jgi:glyoxylase-like metal-dependent hydrolase (beta-lactamase superfamily II)